MDLIVRKKKLIMAQPHIVTTTPDGIANFSTDMIAPLKSCKVEFSPVQSGSGDPSPSNVRPISGLTGCTVYQSGYSMLDSTVREQYSDSLLGLGGGYATPHVSLTAGTPYTFSIGYNSSVGYNIYIRGESGDANVRIITSQTLVSPYVETCTFQVDKSEKYRIWAYKGDGATNSNVAWFTLVSGSTPLLPTIIPVTWSSSGTVYGGYVDLVNGELVATHACVFDSNSASNLTDQKEGFWYTTSGRLGVAPIKAANAGLKTNRLTPIANVTGNSPDGTIAWYANGIIRWREHRDMTTTEYLAYLAENPLQFVYELATPITYQLTPTQLKSLRGVNNIWSDANGDTTVKYWTH